MKVDQNLNLVVAFERADGVEVRVHAAPISFATFEEYALVLGQTFNRLMAQGYTRAGGPRMAARVLKGVLLDEAPQGTELHKIAMQVHKRILAEIHRLAMAIVPTDNGYETVPLDEAISKGMLDEEDVAEVDNALVFFMVNWRMLPRKERRAAAQAAAAIWGGLTTSSNATEYAGSLRTSIEGASSGEKNAAAS